jgi:phage protein D
MTVTATRTSGLPDHYYAPDFVVEVGGVALDPAARGDVVELRAAMGLQEMTSVDLKLNNYDEVKFDLKWSDSAQFRLGSQVHVKLGYADADSMLSIMRGEITTLTPDFPSDGPCTLTVRAVDRWLRLKNSKPPENAVTYKDVADWQIAQRIAQRHDLRIEVDQSGPKHHLVVQKNTDDASFLQERARRVHFETFMRTDPLTGEEVLQFISPRDGRDGRPIRTFVLSWGSFRSTDALPSLLDFKPTMAAGDQVQQVTVRGWDAKSKKKIKQSASPSNTPAIPVIDDTSGPETAKTIGGSEGRKEVIVDKEVETNEEALHLAKSMLAEHAEKFITARGTMIGQPGLRPGDNVEIGGVGSRFSGRYHVTNVNHVLNQQGYLTEFQGYLTEFLRKG